MPLNKETEQKRTVRYNEICEVKSLCGPYELTPDRTNSFDLDNILARFTTTRRQNGE